MGAIIDQLKVILGIESRGFAAVHGQVRNFSDSVHRQFAGLKNTVAGFFTIAAGRELVVSVTHMAERWKDLAEQTGQSTDEVQKFDAAFKRVGLTAEDAARAFDHLTDKRREALEEGGAAETMFRKFGIGEAELRSLDSGAKIFERLSRGRSATNQGDRELFNEMFGTKRGGKLLAGATALEEGKPPSLMSKEDLEKLDEASKAFERAMLEFKIASAPMVTSLVDFARKFLNRMNGEDASGIGDEIVYAATVNAENEAMEHRLAYAKRKGMKASEVGKRSGRAGIDWWGHPDRLIRTDWPGAGGDGDASANPYSVTQKKVADELARSLAETLFKAGNTNDKRRIADARLSALGGAIAAEGDPLKKAKLQSEFMNVAGERASLRDKSFQYSPDQLASVGGYIGGAASIDPSLQVETSQLDVLKAILERMPGQPNNWKEIITDALRGGPMGDVQ